MTDHKMITYLNINGAISKENNMKCQALDSMSSSISRTACSGPLPNIKKFSDRVFRGPCPNKHTCGSIWFKWFHSSSERDQLKMSIFFLILSDFRLHGRTLVPLCSPHRKMTYDRLKHNIFPKYIVLRFGFQLYIGTHTFN